MQPSCNLHSELHSVTIQSLDTAMPQTKPISCFACGTATDVGATSDTSAAQLHRLPAEGIYFLIPPNMNELCVCRYCIRNPAISKIHGSAIGEVHRLRNSEDRKSLAVVAAIGAGVTCSVVGCAATGISGLTDVSTTIAAVGMIDAVIMSAVHRMSAGRHKAAIEKVVREAKFAAAAQL